MKKFRIIEVTCNTRSTYYYAEKRIFGIWIKLTEEFNCGYNSCSLLKTFDFIDEAENYIKNEYSFELRKVVKTLKV